MNVKYLKISPGAHPIQPGESWWVVHPNMGNVEFCVPTGACAICTKPLYHFEQGTVYEATEVNNQTGWITIRSTDWIAEMPFYVFARYFDAEAFVRGVPTASEKILMKTAVNFDYKPTLPCPICSDCHKEECTPENPCQSRRITAEQFTKGALCFID